MAQINDIQLGYMRENKKIFCAETGREYEGCCVTLMALNSAAVCDEGAEIQFYFLWNKSTEQWHRELRVKNDFYEQVEPFEAFLRIMRKDEAYYDPNFFCASLLDNGYESV